MNAERELSFELLDRPDRSNAWMLWCLVMLVAANAAMGVWQYVLRQELAEAQLRQAKSLQPVAPSAPALSEEQLKAEELLRAPVGAWLREIEQCFPEGAVAEQLQLDAANRKVSFTALAGTNVNVAAWLSCMNEQRDRPRWVLRQASRISGGTSGLNDFELRLFFERL